MKNRYTTLILLTVGLLAVFVIRTMLAVRFDVPRLFHLFDTLTIAGSIVLLLKEHSKLKPADWFIASGLGCVVSAGTYCATLYSAYPFFGIIHSNFGQALIRGAFTFLAMLGGLAIMRQGGPVFFRAISLGVGRSGGSILFGLMVGLPLSILNVFALQVSEGQVIAWQSPLAAALDALQPASVEEVIYRFALWGLLWLILRNSMLDRAVWASGMLAMLIHNYSHFDDLFVQSPLVALSMGLVVAIVWGLPEMLLARYKGLESAIAFHWVQDAARFLAGF
jgi:hypothetical protein